MNSPGARRSSDLPALRGVVWWLVTLAVLATPVHAQYVLTGAVIAAGGTSPSAGGAYAIDSTLGQAVAGSAATGAAYTATPGFWALAPVVIVITPTDADGDSLPNDWEVRYGLDASAGTGNNGPSGDPDHDGKTNLQELRDGSHPRGFATRYFAEGATSSFFSTRLALANPGDTQAFVLLRFLEGDGTTASQYLAVPPHRRPGDDVVSRGRRHALQLQFVLPDSEPG
jgi:hypothetical protein